MRSQASGRLAQMRAGQQIGIGDDFRARRQCTRFCHNLRRKAARHDDDHVRLHGLNDRTESANSKTFEAIDNSDARALYLLNEEYVSFYCPRCDCSYCKEHWKIRVLFDDGFYDATYGECPAGHERRMDD